MTRCSGCHTVGGGPLRGPDLSRVAGWERDRLLAAIRTMETHVGPLSTGEVESLGSLLQDSAVKRRLDDARARSSALQAAKLEPPSAAFGRELFFGHRPLLNGGVACQGCHLADGEGGNLARDLTGLTARMEKAAIQSGIESASYPVMRAAYAQHPITAQEAAHLVAFIDTTGAGGARSPDLVLGLGVGLAFSALLAVFLHTRRRVTRPRATGSRRSLTR